MRRTSHEGFFDMYLRYTHEQEAPVVFHRWTALSIVSAMLGRRCWMDRGFYILYPNQYIILVGTSGKVKKDTAADIGMAFLKSCPNCPNFFPGKTTGSALLGLLNGMGKKKAPETGEPLDASIFIVCPEFSAFTGEQPMSNEIIRQLTALYKCQDLFPYVTRAHGEERLRNICINMLAGSNVKYLREAIPESAVGGGFMARMMVVFSEATKPRNDNPKLPSDHKQIREAIVNDLSDIGTLSGPFWADPDAIEFLGTWYRNDPALNYDEDDPLGPFLERKLDHIWKVGMALSAVDSDDMVISLDQARRAKEYVDQMEYGARTVTGRVEATEISSTVLRIFRIIQRNDGEISRVDLQRRCVRFAYKEILDKCLATLMGTHIEKGLKGNRRFYKVLKGAKEF